MAITQADFMKLQNAREKALAESDRPYLVIADDETQVVGDANKTKQKFANYTVGFFLPKAEFPLDKKDIVGETESKYLVEFEYKDVTINPGNNIDVLEVLVELEPFFNKVTENGEVVDLTTDDVRDLLRHMNNEMRSALIHAVATILGVDKSIEEHMSVLDAVFVGSQIIRDFPEAIDEANAVFALSADRVRKRADR